MRINLRPIGSNIWRAASSRTTQAIAAIVVIVVVLIALDLRFHITAYTFDTTPITEEEWFSRRKTLWDWLDLLIVPAVLALSALWFSRVNRRSELSIAEQERELDRQIADERAQEAALQAYLEMMSTLLLEKDLENPVKNTVREVATAWTLTFLRRVKGKRKAVILRFLADSRLIDTGGISLISLEDADLRGTKLIRSKLKNANLSKADLTDAVIVSSDISNTNLSFCELRNATVALAIMNNCDLHGAMLNGAEMEGSILDGVSLEHAHLIDANLDRCTFIGVHCDGTNLTNASLKNSNFYSCDMREVSLLGTDFSGIYYDNTQWPKNVEIPPSEQHPSSSSYEVTDEGEFWFTDLHDAIEALASRCDK